MAKDKKKKKKVIVAMSGGVDSSVAAKLLKDQGYNVLGIFLYFWKEEKIGDFEFENKCCSVKAYLDASRVCQKLGIRLYTLNFSREFKKDVVNNFLDEYKSGRTPNPCVLCNKLVKLGLLIKKAKQLGYDFVATGHYVRLKPEIQNPKSKIQKKLLRAKDRLKDQSYFLYRLNQEELSHLIFPLGNFTKDEVRKMAEKFKLPVAKKKDSQEVCFIPEKSHNEFLKRNLKMKSGPIKTIDRKIIGKHQGLPLYTIGQRKGVEIGGIGPFYVAQTDYKTNTLYVVKNENDAFLFKKELIAKDINWILDKLPKPPLKCQAVIRYRHQPVQCKITKLKFNNRYKVKFSKPQRAVTSGQSVVFYKNEEVLGGGVIE
jgi:tRNA-specific 2-thiouridylase